MNKDDDPKRVIDETTNDQAEAETDDQAEAEPTPTEAVFVASTPYDNPAVIAQSGH